MDMPQTRYRVIERQRRLIVIDTWNGNAPTSTPLPPAAARVMRALDAPGRRTRSSRPPPAPSPRAEPPRSKPAPVPGEKVLTTQSWFDDKAPRRLYIGDGNQSVGLIVVFALFFVTIVVFSMFGWPGLLVAVVIAVQTRKLWRGAVTSFLDGFDEV